MYKDVCCGITCIKRCVLWDLAVGVWYGFIGLLDNFVAFSFCMALDLIGRHSLGFCFMFPPPPAF